jgi:hypothetical protein
MARDDRPSDGHEDALRDEALREGWREPHSTQRGEDQ